MSIPATDISPHPGPAPATRFGLRVGLVAVALALVAVPFALLLFLVQERWRPLLRVDEGARDGLHAYVLDHDWFVTAMRAVSDIGSGPVYMTVFGLVAGWLLWRRLPRLAVFAVVSMVGSSLLNGMVKEAVNRARPVLPDPVVQLSSKSFPSGHAQGIVVASAVLLLIFLPALHRSGRSLAAGLAVIMIVAVGFSRVALGVHYVSDVLAGYVLGAAWVAATTAAFSAWRREEGKPGVEPIHGLEPEHAQDLDPHESRG